MPGALKDIYAATRTALREIGSPNPDTIARYFLSRTLGVSDIEILTDGDRFIDDASIKKLEEALARHRQGEPPSRIFGEREFWGIPFKVTPDVLDPRPDTETIIEAALRHFGDNPPQNILDLGTGTGCIIIALLHEWPRALGVANDISEKALAVARDNARAAGVHERLDFALGSWGESVTGSFDLIVTNPPYIPNPDIANLDVAVKNYDPILALAGGEDGLDCYRLIITKIKTLLKKNGIALFEVGHNQAAEVMRLVEEYSLTVSGVHRDMAGIPRVVEISSGEK